MIGELFYAKLRIRSWGPCRPNGNGSSARLRPNRCYEITGAYVDDNDCGGGGDIDVDDADLFVVLRKVVHTHTYIIVQSGSGERQPDKCIRTECVRVCGSDR